MIRLGSLAGYPFEGPRLLGGWTPPASAAVYAICYKPEPDTKPDRYAVIYVGHSGDLSAERFPFQHPRAHCWVRRAGSKWKVYICTYERRARAPGADHPRARRDLPAALQHRAVRPVLEGRVDRRVLLGPQHRPSRPPRAGHPGPAATPGHRAPGRLAHVP
jgi:hypothetical protein